jgi:hypothetical protein
MTFSNLKFKEKFFIRCIAYKKNCWVVTVLWFLTLYRRNIFRKTLHENVIKIKIKPDQALLKTSYISKEIKKSIAKSCEAILLNICPVSKKLLVKMRKEFKNISDSETCGGILSLWTLELP